MRGNGTIEIARLNDQVRTTFRGGSVHMTAGIGALPETCRQRVFEAVRQFRDFTPDNDPHGEHDCAVIDVDGTEVIWKIDYYDSTLTYHSDNPADASITRRVLTIMLAEEY